MLMLASTEMQMEAKGEVQAITLVGTSASNVVQLSSCWTAGEPDQMLMVVPDSDAFA